MNSKLSFLVRALAVLAGSLMQAGCMTADVRLANLMSRDRAPRSATLPSGYAVQDLAIYRGERNKSKAFAAVFRDFLNSLQEPRWASARL
jgi:hypothetical protein